MALPTGKTAVTTGRRQAEVARAVAELGGGRSVGDPQLVERGRPGQRRDRGVRRQRGPDPITGPNVGK